MSESKDNEKNNAGEESRDASSAEEEVSSSAASEKKSAAPQNTEIAEQQKQADQESRKDQAESKPDDVKAESPQPAKPAKKKGSHRKIWQIAGICVLCFGCGFLGGVTANYIGPGHAQKETASSDRDDLEKIFGQLPEQWDDGSDKAPAQSTQGADDDQDDSDNPFASQAALGITVQQVQASDDQEGGVYVVSIADGSNATDAGVKVGDRIVKADNTEVTGVSALAEYIAGKDVGDTVTLTLKRDGQEVTADVTLISKNSVASQDNQKA